MELQQSGAANAKTTPIKGHMVKGENLQPPGCEQ